MKTREVIIVSVISFLTTLAVMISYTRLRGDNSTLRRPPPLPVLYTVFADNGNTPSGFIPAAAAALRATVHITTKINQTDNNHPDEADPFPGPLVSPSYPQSGSGSGVIISEDGYIVTNNHVIDGASEIKVILSNGITLPAKVTGTDPSSDLAVLKIKSRNLPFLLYGNSDEVKTGQWVLAVGYPLNLQATVTAGIVSTRGRRLEIDMHHYNKVRMEAYIQTDAVVNHGSSGGPLVSTTGRLIGVNAYLASATGAYSGYSFTIPVNVVKRVAEALIKNGSMPHP